MIVVCGCGKKGPPLPPLVKLPVPPADLVAERRGESVDLQFTVPATNTDGTKPANVAVVDVYAVTLPTPAGAPAPPGTPPLTDTELLKLATKVDSIHVKAPKDPNQTVEEDESEADVDAPEGKGLDQGSIARAAEELPDDAATPVDPEKGKKKKPRKNAPVSEDEGPLLPPLPSSVPTRTYFALGLSARGGKGPLSRRITVPLVPAPPAPSRLDLTYDETEITLYWVPARDETDASKEDADAEGDREMEPENKPKPVLPSRPIGYVRPPIVFNVYEIPDEPSEGSGAGPTVPVKLTKTPIAPPFKDNRMAWDEYRCYQVRAVQTVAGVAIESEAPPQVCDTLTDTFPPLAPKALQAVASEGAISLIWEPNGEKDLAGYIVLRAEGDGELAPLTPEPVAATTFKDTVLAGTRYSYAVRAVDKSWNESPLSNRVEEIAR